MDDDIGFHTARAMAELRIASKAADPVIARAHLNLSALHLEALRALCAEPAAGSLSREAGRDAA